MSNCIRVKPSTLSWIILSFATINVVFLAGKRRAFGGFIAQLHKEYGNVTLMELNWIGNSYSAVGHLLTGVATWILLYFNRRYRLFQIVATLLIFLSCITSSFVPNPHWMFLTHTILHGVGSAFILSITSLVVIEYFDSKHPYRILASSLICGGSISSIIFVPLFAYLIQRFNWRNALIVLGFVYSITTGSAAIVFMPNENLNEFESRKYNFRMKDIKRSQIPLMVLWFICQVLTSTVVYGLLLNLTDYLYRDQTNLVDSSVLTTIFATGESVAYLSSAIVTAISNSLLKGKMGIIQIVTAILSCVVLVSMEFTKKLVPLERFLCFLSGLGLGYSNSLMYPVSEELTRLPAHISNVFALAGIGIGMIISPVLTAKLAEIFNYKWFFLIQGLLMSLKIVCLSAIMVLLWFYGKYDINIEYVEEVNIEDESTKLIPEKTD